MKIKSEIFCTAFCTLCVTFSQHIFFYVAEEAIRIQHNFTTLQEELPGIDFVTHMLKHVLSHSNISDIDRCGGVFRQKSKLIKIVLMKGMSTCEEFLKSIELILKRRDLVQQMKNYSDAVTKRGNSQNARLLLLYVIKKPHIISLPNNCILYIKG